MTSDDFLGLARSAAVRACYAYWRNRAAQGLPGRQHLDPGEMKSFLPCVILFDVERGERGYRFRQRLVGTHIVDLFGHDTTGQYVDETSSPQHYVSVLQRLSRVVETHEPSFGVYYPPTPHMDFLEYEHLTLPLAADGVTVDMLFGVRCGLGRGAL